MGILNGVWSNNTSRSNIFSKIFNRKRVKLIGLRDITCGFVLSLFGKKSLPRQLDAV